MKIIIIQLARLGDVIQTLPTIQGLKKAYPGSEITLVTRSTFSDAARLSPHVDKLVDFPSRDILGPCFDASSGGKQEALTRLARWVKTHFAGGYDLLLNLTFSPPSSYLSTIIRAKEKRGICRAADDSISISDPWSQYFFSQVMNQNMNIIHLNDLFQRIAGIEGSAWPLELAEIIPSNPVTPVPTGMTRVGVQLTASVPTKTLNVPTWAAVCNAILEKQPNVELVFFGAKKDLPAINAVLNEIKPAWRCTVLAGTMRFHENLHWVKSCSWMVTPDTAAVHLASVAGRTRIIEIAIGAVRPDETGPYGEGHVVLYPVSCNSQQLGDEVARVISGEKAGLTVAQSVTRLAKRNDGTLRNELVPHNFTPEENGNFFRWSYYLLAEFRCSGRVEEVDIPKLGDPAQKGGVDQLVAAYDALCAASKLAEFGQRYSIEMLQHVDDTWKLTELAAKITETEAMLLTLQKTVPLIKPLIDTWSVAKDVAGAPGQLEEVIGRTEGAYRELKQNIEIIQQLLKSAVEAAQEKIGRNTASKDHGRSLDNEDNSGQRY